MPENHWNRAVRRGFSVHADARRAVDDLAGQLGGVELNAVAFFCSPSYDLDVLGRSVRERFDCPVVGCTTAGEIVADKGYVRDSLVGVGFASPDIAMTPVFIPSLTDFLGQGDPTAFQQFGSARMGKRFALMLIDGLSLLEERVVSAVQGHLPGVPLIGGSAGDGLNFRRTYVYHEGRFHDNAATVALFTTTLPFKAFRIQHFVPSEAKLVITEADPGSRTVMEINGVPAAEEYARIVGVSAAELSPEVFAANPVMVRIGGEYFVRSICRANSDGSLTFFCAIDNGLVLTLARGVDLLENLEIQLHELARDIPDIQLILGCDCILRRIEVQQRQEDRHLAELLSRFPYIGFCTYGEQFNGIHVNQTLTGLALGGGGV
ncbi:FIST N-terminal domain-containing protein [Desulfonatronum sp. SC1]|uniref:FIST N-terminal domain-containing protein n=1 Tax=Desulfonatronum sp. SC1 TaxID=2109626 RepID=UPI000D318854|nr:FIST N-terminal domain-containing protein [Desulfonatronum sp. SC1]PTN36792.1 FIST domain containing protein [Desulfonatronum sp. SC1]